jgi:hypothetical protein
MFTQLPTSPDGLSLLQIQASLTAFRSLQAERPGNSVSLVNG